MCNGWVDIVLWQTCRERKGEGGIDEEWDRWIDRETVGCFLLYILPSSFFLHPSFFFPSSFFCFCVLVFQFPSTFIIFILFFLFYSFYLL